MTRKPDLAGGEPPGTVAAAFLPFVVAPPHSWERRGELSRWTHRHVAMLATPESAGNENVLLGLARIPARQAAPWHRHHGHEEFVFVLEGSGDFFCEGMTHVRVAPGSLNLIPPGCWHMHRASEDRGLVFLWGYTPPGQALAR